MGGLRKPHCGDGRVGRGPRRGLEAHLSSGEELSVKRSVAGAFAAVVASLAFAGQAWAAPCLPTTFIQDSHPLTAAQINPAAVTGPVDATGCDIGVYFDDGAVHSVSGATIENAFYYGVLTRNPGTVTNISNSEIRFIGDAVGGMFLPTGAQH